jgi:cytochrome c553
MRSFLLSSIAVGAMALSGTAFAHRKHQMMSVIAQSLSDEDMANVAAWYSKTKIKAEMPK